MPPLLGRVLLVLSAGGFALTQHAIRRHGIRGAVLVEAACAGLLARDSALLAGSAPGRLRRLPAALLKMETAVAATAAATGLRPLRDPAALRRAAAPHPDRREVVRRAAVALLFALHTARFWIYLRPGRSRQAAPE